MPKLAKLDLQTALHHGCAVIAANPQLSTDPQAWISAHGVLWELGERLTRAAERRLCDLMTSEGFGDPIEYFIYLVGFDAIPVPDLFPPGVTEWIADPATLNHPASA